MKGMPDMFAGHMLYFFIHTFSRLNGKNAEPKKYLLPVGEAGFPLESKRQLSVRKPRGQNLCLAQAQRYSRCTLNRV